VGSRAAEAEGTLSRLARRKTWGQQLGRLREVFSMHVAMKKKSNKYWFWAWTVLGTVRKDRQDDPAALCEVWKNCIILHAHSEREALRKAKKIGRAEAGDCRGSLTLDGKPAICKFLGISSLGLIHDPLGDGAEICWSLRRCRQATALTLPTDETTLLNQAKEELGCKIRAIESIRRSGRTDISRSAGR
jgi:Domain of unknown function (DUF4288)